MRRLVTDKESSSLMIIGAYRSNEVSEDLQEEFEYLNESYEDQVHLVTLNNLRVENIQEMLADVLRCDDDESQPLAEVIVEKTRGNVFFVLQYLSVLDGNGLAMNYNLFKWTWDIDKIRNSTQITSNVVDLLMTKLRRLSADAQNCLRIAACGCWSKISIELLRRLLAGLEIRMEGNVSDAVQEVEAAGHLVALSSGEGYKFAHDRIKEAAYALTPGGLERNRIHYRIGNIFRGFDDGDSSMFIAADQLNRGVDVVQEETEQLDLASLNLTVGRKSLEIAAFSCAFEYLNVGLSIMAKISGNWERHYDLHLSLSQSMADALWCLGKIDVLQTVVDDILKHARCLDDKLPAYYSLAQGLGAQEMFAEALKVEQDVLMELNVFPKRCRSGYMLCTLLQLKRKLKKMSVAELVALPPTEDTRIIAASKLLVLLSKHAVFGNDSVSQHLASILRVKLALDHGICDGMIPTFVEIGIVFSIIFGDTAEGSRLADVSIKMDLKYGGKQYSTVTSLLLV